MSQAFSDFKAAVLDILTVDGKRHGVSLGTAKYADRQIVAALLDLQSFIPQLREGHRTVFKESDLLEDGEASSGMIPDRATITDAYYVTRETCHCLRRPVLPYDWSSRFDLFCGKPKIIGFQYFFSVSPFADEFIIYPKIKTPAELWLYYDGIKESYQDTDEVRYGAEEAEAVAAFVKARICREVDKDITLATSYWISYAGGAGQMGLRSRLFSDWHRRSHGPPTSTSPQPEKMGPCDCGPIKCCYEGADCGFSSGFFYLKDASNLWHKITISGAVGEETFVIGEGLETLVFDDCVTPSAEGYMFGGGWFHILNTTSNLFVSISFSGSGSESVIDLGPQKGALGSISTSARGYRFDRCLKIINTTTGEFCSLNLLETP